LCLAREESAFLCVLDWQEATIEEVQERMATRTAIRQRLDIRAEAREAWEAMVALDAAIGLDESLRVLVKLRASLVNDCVYCIDLHSREGLDAGETAGALFGLASWRESPFFDKRERAALALTDAITLVADGHVPDEVWREASPHFDVDKWPSSSGRSPPSTAGTGSRSARACHPGSIDTSRSVEPPIEHGTHEKGATRCSSARVRV